MTFDKTGRALVLAAGLALPALPAAAQDQIDADLDGDDFVTSDEAMSHSEKVFDEATEGGEEMTLEQFDAVMTGADIVAADAETEGDPETAWDEADADDSDTLTRDEWMAWRQMRFDEAAGDEGQVEAGLYETLYASAMAGVGAGDDSPTEAAPDPDEAEAEDMDAEDMDAEAEDMEAEAEDMETDEPEAEEAGADEDEAEAAADAAVDEEGGEETQTDN